jgi:hypothetical protein
MGLEITIEVDWFDAATIALGNEAFASPKMRERKN